MGNHIPLGGYTPSYKTPFPTLSFLPVPTAIYPPSSGIPQFDLDEKKYGARSNGTPMLTIFHVLNACKKGMT
jgi:hypothetical protein